MQHFRALNRVLWVTLTSVGVVLASANPADGQTSDEDSVAEFQIPASWNRLRHPSGVTLAHPRGWQVDIDRQLGQIHMEGTGAQRVLIWPIFLRGPVSTELSARILMKLAEQVDPHACWVESQEIDDGLVRTMHQSPDREAIAALTWVPSHSGSAGCFYLAATPAGDYRRNERTFTGIVKTFQLAGRDLIESNAIEPFDIAANDARQALLDDVLRRHGRVIFPVDDVIGPDGTAYQVHSGNFFWIDSRGNVIGTQTAMRPDVDFDQMLHLP